MSKTKTLEVYGFEMDKAGKVKSFNGNLFANQLLKDVLYDLPVMDSFISMTVNLACGCR